MKRRQCRSRSQLLVLTSLAVAAPSLVVYRRLASSSESVRSACSVTAEAESFFIRRSRLLYLVHGVSMLPTLNVTGDVLLAEHVSTRLGKLGPGDLVLVRSPLNPNRSLTKRIVGMEGDRITFYDPRHGDIAQTTVVPKGHVWIQGDNIYASRDSRDFGPLPYGLIQGKVFFRVWPPDSFGQPGH